MESQPVRQREESIADKDRQGTFHRGKRRCSRTMCHLVRRRFPKSLRLQWRSCEFFEDEQHSGSRQTVRPASRQETKCLHLLEPFRSNRRSPFWSKLSCRLYSSQRAENARMA